MLDIIIHNHYYFLKRAVETDTISKLKSLKQSIIVSRLCTVSLCIAGVPEQRKWILFKI